jgi:hypothetical protein
MAVVRRHVPEPDLTRALLLIEEQRRSNMLLRSAAAEHGHSVEEIAKLDARIAALMARRK